MLRPDPPRQHDAQGGRSRADRPHPPDDPGRATPTCSSTPTGSRPRRSPCRVEADGGELAAREGLTADVRSRASLEQHRRRLAAAWSPLHESAPYRQRASDPVTSGTLCLAPVPARGAPAVAAPARRVSVQWLSVATGLTSRCDAHAPTVLPRYVRLMPREPRLAEPGATYHRSVAAHCRTECSRRSCGSSRMRPRVVEPAAELDVLDRRVWIPRVVEPADDVERVAPDSAEAGPEAAPRPPTAGARRGAAGS